MRRRFILTFIILGIVLALYFESFPLPAVLFCTTASHVRPAGVQSAARVCSETIRPGSRMAFLSLFAPFLLNFAGFANPLLLVGGTLLVLRRTRAAVGCLAAAALCALQTFQLLLFAIPEDEGGVMRSFMIHPLVGWYCWFAAILLALLLAVSLHMAEAKPVDR